MRREIRDDEVVTQYGSRASDPPFRSRPRGPMQRAMSVTLGRRTAAEMAALVGRKPDGAIDLARYARVGDLRRAGFDVRHTPSQSNPEHASVEWPDEWSDTVAARFDLCFGTGR